MPLNPISIQALENHPCFSANAHFRCARIHLPVAPACNIQCAYCDRRFDCPNESRPGVASSILTPEEALNRVEKAAQIEPNLHVVGIAGPGEPLYNPATMETLRLIRDEFPQFSLCLSTNGLLLPEKLEELLSCNVATLTVTLNTLRPETAEKLYVRTGPPSSSENRADSIEKFLNAQRTGIQMAVNAGVALKINTVLVPGINDEEIPEIARAVGSWGAVLMNIIPLIPMAAFSGRPRPAAEMVREKQRIAGKYLPQFTHCRQCRADACGIPGKYDLKF